MVPLQKLASFFEGWEETLISSCLQGHMGYALVDNESCLSAVQLVVGDFCFFAGKPQIALIEKAAAPIIIPHNEEWSRAIEAVWAGRADKALRYAIKKEPNTFDVPTLTAHVNSLPPEYTLKQIEQEEYDLILEEAWSRDLCSQFTDYQDFKTRGIGVAALYQGKPVAGAASYGITDTAIEIEIDTKPEFRQKGLATACGAQLILDCLRRGLYPSWDAHDLRSVALAEKLGYHLDHPYTIYLKR